MNELIRIETNHKGTRVVSAKELYEYLSIDDGSHFSRWGKTNIEDMFVENTDYQILRHNGGNPGRPSIDYALTIDCAKEVSMMSRCNNGKRARMYFIEMEKIAKSTHQITVPSKKELAQWVVQLEEEKEKLIIENKVQEQKIVNQNLQIRQMAPKVELAERVIEADGLVDIGQAAKLLRLPYGRNTFFRKLRERGIFFEGRNEPKQAYMKYFEVKETFIDHINKVVMKVYINQKGLEYLSRMFCVKSLSPVMKFSN